MCGRYKLMQGIKDMQRALGAKAAEGFDWEAHVQVFPSQIAPVLVAEGETGARQLRPMRWGLLPPYEKNPKARGHINARSETLAALRSFKQAFATRRCLIPAEGFYEWEKPSKRRHLFTPQPKADGSADLFTLAGLWQPWRGPEGQRFDTFTILTCAPNETVAPVHDRMPVILSGNEAGAWLAEGASREELQSLLAPYPAGAMQDAVEGQGEGSPKENTDRVDEPA